MVARNPLFAVRWTKKLLKVTVLDDIWPEILFFTTVATVVCVVSDKTPYNLGISNVLVAVLGNVIIIQAIVSFRTSSASERYQEGRTLWTSLANTARNLAQTIWIHIPNKRGTSDNEGDEMQGILEKRSIINIIQALVVSVKHFVRDEKGIDYEDLYPLLCWLPAFSNFTPDHPYWYKLDSRSSSATLLDNPYSSRPVPHQSRPSLPRRNRSSSHSGEDSTTDVDSDVEAPRGALPRAASSPRGSSETAPLTQSPTIDEPGSSNAILYHSRCLSPESTLFISDSDSSPTQAFRQPPKRRSAGCRYQSIKEGQQHVCEDDVDSEEEEDKPTASGSLRGTRKVHFRRHTLVSSPEIRTSNDVKEQLSRNGTLFSPLSSTDPPEARLHTDLEDLEAGQHHLHPDHATYSRILPHVPTLEPLKPAADPPPERIRDVFPLWRFLAFLGRKIRRVAAPNSGDEAPTKRRKRNPYIMAESSVPLQIWLALSSYLAYLSQNKLMPASAIEKSITDYILSLQDVTAQLERLTNTPLPFAYQVHMRMCTWLYLLFLPFQIYDNFGYVTIPLVALATFMLIGFMEIGEEIENPFDYDHNDLNLDHFCLQLQRELHEITAQIHPIPSSILFSSHNYPLAPIDWRAADVLVAEDAYCGSSSDHGPYAPSLQRTLLHCWREIDAVTRKRV